MNNHVTVWLTREHRHRAKAARARPSLASNQPPSPPTTHPTSPPPLPLPLPHLLPQLNRSRRSMLAWSSTRPRPLPVRCAILFYPSSLLPVLLRLACSSDLPLRLHPLTPLSISFALSLCPLQLLD